MSDPMTGPMTGPAPDVDRLVDCRGLPCPRPIIELAKTFAQVEVGATVGVVADDPAAEVDVHAWCRMRGQEYVGSWAAADGVPTYVVRRLS